MKCVAKNKDGSKCKCSVKDGKHCFFHNPANAKKLHIIRSKGGKAGLGSFRKAHVKRVTNCMASNKDGNKCKGAKMKNSQYCFFHDPQNLEQLRTIRSQGGKARKAKTVHIPLTPGARSLHFAKRAPQFALVDKEDAANVLKHWWRASYHTGIKKWFATRKSTLATGQPCTVYLHREILGLTPGQNKVRFKSGRTVDCRKRNLFIPHTCNSEPIREVAKAAFRARKPAAIQIEAQPNGGIKLTLEISAGALKLLKASC